MAFSQEELEQIGGAVRLELGQALSAAIDPLKMDIRDLQRDMREVKRDVAALKQNVALLAGALSTLRGTIQQNERVKDPFAPRHRP